MLCEQNPGQLRDFFQWNNKIIRCLVYTEDAVTKTNDRGLSNLKKKAEKSLKCELSPSAFGQQIYVSLSSHDQEIYETKLLFKKSRKD